jgi:hypothetical protein
MEQQQQISQEELITAYEQYTKHKETMRKYYEKNKEKFRERAQKYYKSVIGDPEKHKAYLEKKKLDAQRKRAEQKTPPKTI